MHVRSHLAAFAGLLALLLCVSACQPSGETPSASDADANTAASSADAGEAMAMPDAAQKAQEAESRLEESEAGQILLESINAHGGLEAWYAAPTSSYTWE